MTQKTLETKPLRQHSALRQLVLLSGCVLASISTCGCQSTNSFSMPTITMPKMSMPTLQSLNPMNMFNQKQASVEPKVPHRMAVIWKDASISDVGKPTTRGFGGRVYFYDENNEPVRVDGELSVYGYEDGENEDTNSADRKYVFEQPNLESHYSETEIGPSYSFWIPWDKAGGNRQTVALLPVFKDSSGRVVQGGHSLNTLNGKAPVEQTLARTDIDAQSQYRNQQAGNLGPNGGSMSSNFAGAQVNHVEENGRRRMKTSTIKVPRSMALRMRNQNQQAAINEAVARIANSQQQLDARNISPLISQLQAQNNLGTGQSVTYGNQIEPQLYPNDMPQTNNFEGQGLQQRFQAQPNQAQPNYQGTFNPGYGGQGPQNQLGQFQTQPNPSTNSQPAANVAPTSRKASPFTTKRPPAFGRPGIYR